MLKLCKFVAVLLLIVFATGALPRGSKTSVAFRIAEISRESVDDGEHVVWTATHQSSRGVAKFQLSMLLKWPSDKTPYPFSKGSFTHVASSEPDEFLAQLSAALSAKLIPGTKSKVNRLPFDVVFLGHKLSRAGRAGQFAGGAFSAKPPGSWIATKIFLAGGKGQVFLNLDPVNGVGEFSIKDEDYGNVVVSELARVL